VGVSLVADALSKSCRANLQTAVEVLLCPKQSFM